MNKEIVSLNGEKFSVIRSEIRNSCKGRHFYSIQRRSSCSEINGARGKFCNAEGEEAVYILLNDEISKEKGKKLKIFK